MDNNISLRAARERTPSRVAPGEAMSRCELAEAVNAWLWNTTGKRYDLDAHAIAPLRAWRRVLAWRALPHRPAPRTRRGQ